MYGRGWEAEPQDALIAKGTSHEGCSIGKKPKVRAYGRGPLLRLFPGQERRSLASGASWQQLLLC